MPQTDNTGLPAPLRRRFAALRRRLLTVETVLAASAAVSGVFGAYLLLFGSDRFWDTVRPLRAALFFGAIGVVAFALLFWLRRWVFCRRDDRALSRVVQRRHGGFGDRLLGAVELADVARRPPNVSAALCDAAIRQVAQESERVDFPRVVQAGRARRNALSAGLLVALAGALCVMLRPAGRNAWERLRRPFRAVPRYTFAAIEGLPDRMVVAHGEPGSVGLHFSEGAVWRPRRGRYRIGRQVRGSVLFSNDTARIDLPRLAEDTVLHVRVGDARHATRITPRFRPSLLSLHAEIVYPDYLRWTNSMQEAGPALTLLEGSRFRLHGVVSRALAAGTMHAAGMETALALEDARFRSKLWKADAFDHGHLWWRDRLGLEPKSRYPVSVSVRADATPFVDCPGLPENTAILVDETLEVRVEARDDCGVDYLSIEWQPRREKEPADGVVVRQLERVADGGPHAKRLVGTFLLCPAVLGVPPKSIIALRAMAGDYFPGRNPATSPEYRVYVLSRSEHVRLLKERFEGVLETLEELTRDEEALLKANRQLQALSKPALREPRAAEKLERQANAEAANAEAMRGLADKTARILEEALRNRGFPLGTLAEWSEMFDTMQAVGRQEMPEVSQSLKRGKADVNRRAEELAAAVERQKQILEALKSMQSGSHSLMDRMTASNFVNRFREAAARESGINRGLQQVVSEVLGLLPENLSEPLKKALGTLAEQQGSVAKSVKYIQDDLRGFAERVDSEAHHAVHDEMRDKAVLLGLDAVGRGIQANRTFAGIQQTASWAEQLEQWAAALERAARNADQSGQDGAQMQMTAEQLELMARVVRLVRGEQELRAQTRALDEQRGRDAIDAQVYGERAANLAGLQKDLHTELTDIAQLPLSPPARALLGKAGKAMNDAENLLRLPATGTGTIAAETEVIELLTSSAKQASAAQMSAFMRAMMARLAQGRGAGGSLAGGDWAKGPKDADGDAAGATPEARRRERAVGVGLERIPVEFREALEAYLKRVGGDR